MKYRFHRKIDYTQCTAISNWERKSNLAFTPSQVGERLTSIFNAEAARGC